MREHDTHWINRYAALCLLDAIAQLHHQISTSFFPSLMRGAIHLLFSIITWPSRNERTSSTDGGMLLMMYEMSRALQCKDSSFNSVLTDDLNSDEMIHSVANLILVHEISELSQNS